MPRVLRPVCEGVPQVDQQERLGCGATGAAAIREHAYFRGVDWAALEAGTLRPPCQPPQTDPLAAPTADELR